MRADHKVGAVDLHGNPLRLPAHVLKWRGGT
jgi:hypothetical protein